MHRSGRESRLADPGSSEPPSRRPPTALVRRLLMAGCALAAAFALIPASAHADPEPSESELRTKIDKLTSKAEVITEKYNGQRLELKKAKKTARQAERRSERLSRRLEKTQDAVAELAATQYKSGGMQRSVSLLAAESPDQLINRATMLAHLSQQQATRVGDLQGALRQAEQAEKEAKQATDKVAKITEGLQDKSDHIKKLVAEAKDKLAELEAEQAQASGGSSSVPVDVEGSGLAARALEIALAQQGDPYVWAAEGPDAFDCSGLAVYAFGQVGVSVPHHTGAIWDSYPHVSQSELRPGDIVFTSSHHMGIYVGNGQMVHAPNSGEVVKVEDVYEFYGAVRVV